MLKIQFGKSTSSSFFAGCLIPLTLLYNELQVQLIHFCALPSSSMHIHTGKWVQLFATWWTNRLITALWMIFEKEIFHMNIS